MTDLDLDSQSVADALTTVGTETVILDSDLAAFFGTSTSHLNQQVQRNLSKFDGFARRLSKAEWADLKSQNMTSSGHGGRRKPPVVFSEQGVAMAATVLTSYRAVQASRLIVNTFVEARRGNLPVQEGQNLPQGAPTLSLEARRGLAEKLHGALGDLIDAIVDIKQQEVIQAEARVLAREGVEGLRELLQKPGVENDVKRAEIGRIIAETEKLNAEAEGQGIENRHRALALRMKQMRLMIGALEFFEGGSSESFLRLVEQLDLAGED